MRSSLAQDRLESTSRLDQRLPHLRIATMPVVDGVDHRGRGVSRGSPHGGSAITTVNNQALVPRAAGLGPGLVRSLSHGDRASPW